MAGGPQFEMVVGVLLQFSLVGRDLGEDLVVGTGEGQPEDGANIAHGELDAATEGVLRDVEVDV